VSPLPELALVAVCSAAGAAALATPGPRRAPPRAGARKPPREAPRPLRSLATAAVALGAMVFVGGAWGVPVGLVAGAACWWATGRMEPPAVRRRRERLAAAVPHAVDLMAACLSVGLSPAAAVEQVAKAVEPPLAEELASVCARLRLGVDPVTVWRDLAAHPQLGGLGRTVARAAESGASVADAMLRLSDDLRRQVRAEVESRARAVGVKAALPLGTCLLPAFVLVGVVPLVAGSVSVLLR
jgi:Flp pilus assembly protein TadB